MKPRLPARLAAASLATVACMAAAAATPASASPPAAGPAATLPSKAVAAGLAARGNIVRREPGLVVERVGTRGGPGKGAGSLYRLTLRGRYPPRALRYEVRAGDRTIAYGIPGPHQRALRAVTADASVLRASISARYEGGGETPPDPPPTPSLGDPSPAPAAELPGPFEVSRATYDLGDRAFKPSKFPRRVELAGDVHFPSEPAAGPFPLVLFLHGNHTTCYRGTKVRYEWPCSRGFKALPNYAGYDYIAERLASYGFVVASVSGNGVNVLGNRVRDTGMRQRGELLQRHVKLWREWATAGGEPFGSAFVGRVDLDRIGVMGHSRGGEGAVWQVIVDRARETPFGIDAVLPLAPVDFTRRTVNRVPLAVMLPYCDGDVSDLQGVHFFDDARYRVPGDETAKHTVTVWGANHNFFNTVWSPGNGYPGGFDDGRWSGTCRGKLLQAQQRKVGAAYVVSFFRRYVAEDIALDPVWTGEQKEDIAPARALVTQLAPDTPDRRLDLNRFTARADLTINRLGGEVVPRRLPIHRWCPGNVNRPCAPGRYSFLDVHHPGLSRGVFGWHREAARLHLEIPPGEGDVHSFDALQLRAAPNPGYPEALQVRRQDLVVELVDGAGNRAKVAASEVGSRALALPSGLRDYSGHTILNQVRYPLADFEGVDLGDVRRVVLHFSPMPRGAIDIADLAFTAGAG